MKRTSALALLVALLVTPAAALAQAPEAVTFDQAVSTALAHNPSTAVARAAVQAADAQRRQVRAGAMPALSGNAAYTQLDGDRVLAGRTIQGQSSFGANLLLSAPLLSASRWGAWRRAADAVTVQEAGVRASEREVALAAGRAYLAVLLGRRGVEVARVARETAKQHLAIAEQRWKGGVGTRLDVVRAAQEVESTETQVASAEVVAARAREALGVALGVDHPVDASGEPDLGGAPPAAASSGPGAGSETGIDRRADLVLARRSLWAAERGAGDRWRDFLPTLTATFSPFYQNPPTSTLPEWGWQAQLALSLPLYDGGLRYGQAEERDAVLAAARARLDQASRQARADERSARVAVDGAELALRKARSSAQLAHEAAELARVAFTAGAGTSLDLIDADRRARDADALVALAEDTLRQSQLELLAAAGSFP